MQMAIPNLIANSQNPQQTGNSILQAALKQQQPNPAASGGGAPAGGISGMMNNGLLAKMFPSLAGGQPAAAPAAAPGGPVGPGIDPNTGLPPTGASAAMPNLGGAGPAPTAMTGLW
jgi:hypothetical protein